MAFAVMLVVAGLESPRAAKAQKVDIFESGKSGNVRGGAVVGAAGSTIWVLRPDSLISLDFASGSRRAQSVPDLFGRLGADTRPSSNSMSVSRDGRWAWTWDASVGSVYRVGLADSSVSAFERYSSRTQFKHAGGLHPVTQRPLVYSGYGYYRAKEFMLTFNDSVDTWQEVPFNGSLMPSPRMSSIMVYGWDPTRVAVAGGSEALPGVSPPEYSRDLTDYWVFDTSTSEWSRHLTPTGFDCALRRQEVQLGFIPVSLEHSSAFVLIPDDCGPGAFEAGDVIAWNPHDNVFAPLGQVDATRPEGYQLASVYADATSSAVHVVYWKPDQARDFATWSRIGYTFALVTPDTTSTWPWWLVVVAVLPVLVWLRFRATSLPADHAITLSRLPDGRTVRLSFNGKSEVVGLSSVSHIALNHLQTVSTGKDSILDPDLLSDAFLEYYPDPDSARVMKNRAVDELNEVARRAGLKALIVRERQVGDARRINYRLTATLWLGDADGAGETT